MECLSTINSLKINLKKNIGTILIVVEGGSDEFELFKHIFRDILHYKYTEKTRLKSKFKNYEFVMKGNESSRVIVINAKNSNINTLKKDKEYLNDIYIDLYNEYGIDIKNINVYFVWDRDHSSNSVVDVKELLCLLTNSLDNKDGEMNGLLLLSYPALESYIISCYEKNTLLLKETDLKEYNKKNKYLIKNIDKNMLLKATVSMHRALNKLGIEDYNLEDFKETSLKIFNKQEEILKIKNYYYLLSMMSLIFIDLGIITEKWSLILEIF